MKGKGAAMGLAASQARLLSITSRMADNELRSQLINNAKMRLTTESSNVSDEYIAALNKTQLMFTNFDLAGNEQYQDLTFNSLTAYSSYNNQYGIVNNAGQLMVSKTDAVNFESSANVEEFLSKYGLEQSTTYFEQNQNDIIGYYDDYGVWQETGVTMGEMQDIYEGNIDANGIDHYGYEGSLNSIEYGDYEKLLNNYSSAKDLYNSELQKRMNAFIGGESSINGITLKVNGQDFEYYLNKVSALDESTASDADINNYTNTMIQFLELLGLEVTGNVIGSATDSMMLNGNRSQTFIDSLNANLGLASTPIGSNTTSYAYIPSPVVGKVAIDEYGNKTYITSGDTKWIGSDGNQSNDVNIDGYGTGDILDYDPGLTDEKKVLVIDIQEGYTYEDLYYYKTDQANYAGDGNGFTITNEDGTISYYNYTTYSDYTGDKEDLQQYIIEGYDGILTQETYPVEREDVVAALKYMYSYFSNNLLSNLNEDPFKDGDTVVIEAREQYEQAALALAQFIYGTENGTLIATDPEFLETYIDYLGDPSWVLSTNNKEEDVDKDGNPDIIDKSHYNPWADIPTSTTPATNININGNNYLSNYQVVKDAFLIECMLERYGDPTYTWIDTENSDENAEAKAQWYTNLYERMKLGYKEMPENLCGSQEWLQFAFESGLVHMEQVNKSQEWVSTMYTNCSDISESTVDVDVTLAEAKYNREMNKIQAKDKQYDLELKNIDTEHNSLQTEYDSIKSVIDKNIERNYKMFSA